MDTILVTGGTGVLGAQVVRQLLDDGRQVRVLSRKEQRPATLPEKAQWAVGDLTAGTGLKEALAGVGTVVHCASDARRWKNDLSSIRHLIDAARPADGAAAPHVVYVSIVGIDRVPYSYYRAKLEVERLLAASGLPWTVLRATQFHDLLLVMAQQLSRLPVVLVPAGARVQPVDVDEVATRLAELAEGAPAGRVADMGGPKTWTLTDVVRAVVRASGRPRRVVSVPLPGKMMAALRDGGLLAPDDAAGHRGFEAFLADAPVSDRTYGAARRPVATDR